MRGQGEKSDEFPRGIRAIFFFFFHFLLCFLLLSPVFIMQLQELSHNIRSGRTIFQ